MHLQRHMLLTVLHTLLLILARSKNPLLKMRVHMTGNWYNFHWMRGMDFPSTVCTAVKKKIVELRGYREEMKHVYDVLKTDSTHQQVMWAGGTDGSFELKILQTSSTTLLNFWTWPPAPQLEDSSLTWHTGKSSWFTYALLSVPVAHCFRACDPTIVIYVPEHIIWLNVEAVTDWLKDHSTREASCRTVCASSQGSYVS